MTATAAPSPMPQRTSRLGRWLEELGPIVRFGVIAVVGVILPAIVLFAVNAVWRGLLGWDVPGGLWGDLAFAVVVYFGAAWLWFRFGLGPRRRAALVAVFCAIAAAVLFVVVLPVGVTAVVALLSARHDVPASAPLASKLDVLILTAGGRSSPPPRSTGPALPLWNVQYSVGRVDGTSIDWRLANSPDARAALAALTGAAAAPRAAAPVIRPDADTVLLLDPDATPPVAAAPQRLASRAGSAGEVSRWRELVARSGLPAMPTFALLQSTDTTRLGDWSRWLAGTGGDAVSAQQLGEHTLTDAAVQLGSDAPGSDTDLALAYKHRPLLFFASGERFAQPFDVDAFLESGLVSLCSDTGSCQVVRRASELVNGRTHLRVNLGPAPPRRALGVAGALPAQPAGAIYVHVTHDSQRPALVYLDYWWYLPYNDNPVAENSFCGPGFTIAELTCDNHESDWEGVTVVVDSAPASPVVTSVHYAEHTDVVAYRWPALRRLWEQPGYARLTRSFADADQRPLVFAARGSHASYPTLCSTSCKQPASGLPEGIHDGALRWKDDPDQACALACVKPIPTRKRGTAAALWAAFEGAWGERHCLFEIWCDVSGAPTAPPSQGRYAHPEHVDATPALR